MSTDIPTKRKRDVIDREGGRCAACWLPAIDVHHRRGKKMGGTSAVDIHDFSNLLATCRRHHDLIHAGPAAAVLGGWMVPTISGVSPGMVPVWMRSEFHDGPAWFALDNDGGVRLVSDLHEPLTLLPGMPSLLPT